MTNPEGSQTLDVNGAAGAFLGMMGNDSEQEQSEPVEQELQESGDAPEGEASQETESEEAQEPQRYRVKAAGEEIEVTLDELINGYQHQRDYTKKTQALAEQRKALEAEASKVEESKKLRDAYAQRLQAVEQFLSQQTKQEDLAYLKETDPIGYAVKVAENTEREKELAILRHEQARIAQQQQAEREEGLKSHISREAEKLNSLIPELATKDGDNIRKQIREYAKSTGWTDAELANVYDHRAVLALYKAMKYEQLQSSKADVTKRVQSAPKMLKAGATPPPTADAELRKQAIDRVRKSGRVADAARAFEQFL